MTLLFICTPTAGERHSEEREAGSGRRPPTCRPQPNSGHVGDRDQPADAHGGAEP